MGSDWAAQRGMPEPDRYPHGTRSRYVQAKCRCDLCRKANRDAYHDRQRRQREVASVLPRLPPGSMCPGVAGNPCPRGVKLRRDSMGACDGCRRRLVFNGVVDAAPARAHLKKLSRRGIGYRTVADAARVSASSMAKVWKGTRTKIRGQLLRRILAVDESVRADGSTVPAGPTWRLIRAMVDRGWTKGGIARAIGRKMPALQLNRPTVVLSTAHKIRRLWETHPDPPRPRQAPGPRPRVRLCDCSRPIPIRDSCARCERLLPAQRRAAA